jgi:hypothetical protein
MKCVRSVRVLVVTLGMAGALTACQQDTTDATAGSARSTATSSDPSAAATTAAAAATTAAATPAAATPAAATPAAAPATNSALVLGPDGLGALKLGMNRGQAEATGVVAPFTNEPNSDQCRWRSKLKGAPADKGTVLYSNTLGVASIDAYAGVRTPEGITIGSPLSAVDQAYPGWNRPTTDTGHGHAQVPGHSQVVYRIAYAGGAVAELTLQYAHQDCYE